ncbi:hypothetical protein ACG02S_15685 [Roseateles sp. DC23W]|uniref:Uncharacterized protein n=1 Tax=Pelomonas dachongensis TaxID=3299029 RepID=A0ABW7EPS4_9BURK
MALLTEFVEPKWQRPRGIRRIHVVAVLCAFAAVGVVLAMFVRYGIVQIDTSGDRLLVATVDLRLGTPALAAERGAAQARFDIEAGELKVQSVGPKPGKAELARAARMKQRYGVDSVNKSEQVTPETSAYVDAYNRVMRAEIERKHGKDVADGLLGFEKTRPTVGASTAS